MDYHLLLIWAPFLLGLGGVVGFLAGLLGLGGGILLVPGLFYSMTALGFPAESMMHVSVGTSLAIIIPTGMSSVRAHWKRGGVRVDLLKKIGIGIVAGVVAGTIVADHISGHTLKVIFATMLGFLAVIINIDPNRFTLAKDIPPQPWSALTGTLIGFLSTLMGIGGATITVPYMTLCSVPIKQAVGTASALGIMIAVPAVIGFLLIGQGQGDLPPFSIGYINMLAWILIVPASVLMAPVGAHMAHNVPVKLLRRIFAAFLMIVAAKMLYTLLHG
jgi:uncharacterized membrane protein YfcA